MILTLRQSATHIDASYSNSQYGLFFATENTEIHGKSRMEITKKYPNGFFFEFFRVFCVFRG